MAEESLKLPSELLEPNILIHCLNNVSFFLKVKPYIATKNYKSKSYFNDNKYQFVFNVLNKWYEKYNKFPTLKEALILNEKLNADNEELRILIKSILDNVYNGDYTEVSSEYIEEETLNFIKENNVYEAMMMSQLDVQQGNFGAIADRMREAISVNFDKDLGISIKDLETGMNAMEDLSSEKTISTGFPSLDEALDGGFRDKEIYIFAATPGVGKTALLGNFALNAFLQNKNVLVYTFETSTKRLLSRYYANLVNMTKREIIMDSDLTKEKINEIISENYGDLIIKEYPANSMSSNGLLAHINDLKMYNQWEPDLLITDYLLLQSTNDIRMNPENSYKYYKTVTEETRNLGKLLEIPVLSATQINRSGQDDKGGTKAITTSKDISESRGIYDTADFFATINQPARDREENKVMIYIDKSRNEAKGQKIRLNIDYPHMRFFE